MHPLFTRIRQSVGDLYLYRYVTQNLRFALPELTQVFREAKAHGSSCPAKDVAAHYAAIDRFLAELPARSGIETALHRFPAGRGSQCHLRPALASPRKTRLKRGPYLIRRASALGYRVRTAALFLEHYKSHRRHFDTTRSMPTGMASAIGSRRNGPTTSCFASPTAVADDSSIGTATGRGS